MVHSVPTRNLWIEKSVCCMLPQYVSLEESRVSCGDAQKRGHFLIKIVFLQSNLVQLEELSSQNSGHLVYTLFRLARSICLILHIWQLYPSVGKAPLYLPNLLTILYLSSTREALEDRTKPENFLCTLIIISTDLITLSIQLNMWTRQLGGVAEVALFNAVE